MLVEIHFNSSGKVRSLSDNQILHHHGEVALKLPEYCGVNFNFFGAWSAGVAPKNPHTPKYTLKKNFCHEIPKITLVTLKFLGKN